MRQAPTLLYRVSKRGRILDELSLIFYLYGGTESKDITMDVTKEINGTIEEGLFISSERAGVGC